MTKIEAINIITREIKALSSNFVSNDYVDAINTASRETGFSFPTSTSFQIKWLIERAKRALFFSLLSENVESFKFKQINLQDKFKNLKQIVDSMDLAFEKAIAEFEFANVSVTQAFGHKVDAGFAYDAFGKEVTYDKDQLVTINPSSSD